MVFRPGGAWVETANSRRHGGRAPHFASWAVGRAPSS